MQGNKALHLHKMRFSLQNNVAKESSRQSYISKYFDTIDNL